MISGFGLPLQSSSNKQQGSPSNPAAKGEVEASTPSWEISVAQLGQEIRSVRQVQGITLQEIHLKTKVPLHHLRSIEAGEVQKLPDAIFVRGFLLKVCRALEAETLLAQLPERPVSPPPPSVTRPGLRGRLRSPQLNVAHLYFGYGVLLAGAVGGLAWTESGAQAHYPRHQAEQSGRAEANAVIRRRQIRRAIAASPSISPPSLQGPEFGL